MGGSQPATKKQKAYIQRLLRAFPDARELLEYEDYLKNQTRSPRRSSSDRLERTVRCP